MHREETQGGEPSIHREGYLAGAEQRQAPVDLSSSKFSVSCPRHTLSQYRTAQSTMCYLSTAQRICRRYLSTAQRRLPCAGPVPHIADYHTLPQYRTSPYQPAPRIPHANADS
eukprot:1177509-Rhodomonas_salina.4